jgi:hypothetical protein
MSIKKTISDKLEEIFIKHLFETNNKIEKIPFFKQYRHIYNVKQHQFFTILGKILARKYNIYLLVSKDFIYIDKDSSMVLGLETHPLDSVICKSLYIRSNCIDLDHLIEYGLITMKMVSQKVVVKKKESITRLIVHNKSFVIPEETLIMDRIKQRTKLLQHYKLKEDDKDDTDNEMLVSSLSTVCSTDDDDSALESCSENYLDTLGDVGDLSKIDFSSVENFLTQCLNLDYCI